MGFCWLFPSKRCPFEVSFCQASSSPLIIKEKADPEVVCRCDMQLFLLLLFLERTKKRSRFLPFRKNISLSCWFWERKGSKFPFFFSKSPRSARPALSKNAIALFRFRYGYMKRCYICRKGDIKAGRQAGCSPIVRGAVSFHLSGIDPLTMGWEANKTDCRRHQRDRLLSSVADPSFSPMIYLS